MTGSFCVLMTPGELIPKLPSSSSCVQTALPFLVVTVTVPALGNSSVGHLMIKVTRPVDGCSPMATGKAFGLQGPSRCLHRWGEGRPRVPPRQGSESGQHGHWVSRTQVSVKRKFPIKRKLKGGDLVLLCDPLWK